MKAGIFRANTPLNTSCHSVNVGMTAPVRQWRSRRRQAPDVILLNAPLCMVAVLPPASVRREVPGLASTFVGLVTVPTITTQPARLSERSWPAL